MLCGHDTPLDGCPSCERAKTDKPYAEFARGVPSPAMTPKPHPRERFALPDCIHMGDATGETGQCLGCGVQHQTEPLRTCDIHGVCTRDRPVKDIDGKRIPCCLPGHCQERQVEAKVIGHKLLIPQPPALDLTPKSSWAIVTVVVGTEAEKCFSVSGPLMQRYADRFGIDLVVLHWPGHPSWPMSSKFAIPRVLEHYERIAYLDTDVLLRDRCVDLFSLCAADEFGAADELPFHQAKPHFKREQEYLAFRRDMGFRNVPHVPWYFNAGVMVVPRVYRELLLPPTQPIRTGHCAEQDHTNAMVLDSGAKVRLLDRRSNWQSWTSNKFQEAPPDAILHWSGSGGGRSRRAELMLASLKASQCI